MKIRKYLREMKNSATNSSSFTLNYVPQPLICRLNQSPWDVPTWDVPTFTPSDTEEHVEQVNTTIRLFGVDISTNPHRSVPQSDVPSSTACVHQEEPEKDDKACNRSVEAREGGDDACEPIGEASEGRPRRKRKGKGIVEEEITLCPEPERNGWQCAQPVKPGFNMCPRHWKNISPVAGRKSIKTSSCGKLILYE